jgi:hypothetical protein
VTTGPSLLAGRKVVVSVPRSAGACFASRRSEASQRFKVRGAHTIIGPHVELVEGSRGMLRGSRSRKAYGNKGGHKVDGGETKGGSTGEKKK